jgi:predicted nuclease of predicted toxin-antitoxin system
LKAQFLADADLHPGIVRGICARNSEVDFKISQTVLPEGARDPEVLAFAAENNRVLVSHDVNTMPGHFREFTVARRSPGLILIPQRLGIGTAIEELLLVWECTDAKEFQNQVLYLPL